MTKADDTKDGRLVESERADATVETLPEGSRLPDTAVTLEGDAALGLADALGSTAVEAFKGARRVRSTDLYRIVPREDLAQGLADKRLRMAIPRKGGDASVQVKNTATGRFAGRADLRKAKPSATKALGPVAWQAMALATQQHYLVEINDKLAGVEGAVTELLARLTDDKRAKVEELREEATRIRSRLASGETVSAGTIEEMLFDAGVVQKSLAATAERAANDYLVGESTANQAEEAFTLALFAAQTLADLSGLLVSLPAASTGELQRRLDTEWARLEPRRERLRAVAATLSRGHHHWRMHQAIYEERRPRHVVARSVNRLSPLNMGEKPPRGLPLSADGVHRAESLLDLPPPAPESVLVEVTDGTVRVAVERERPGSAPSDLRTDDDIDRSITKYSDGKWYVEGHYGPYGSREAAVARLRSL